MRIILAIISGIALLAALLGIPDLMLSASRGGSVAPGAFTVFVLAGGLSTVLYLLEKLKAEAKAQTKLLEEIASQGRKNAPPKRPSALQYPSS